MTEKEYKEATSGNVVKFENPGDSLEGIYLGYDVSSQYNESYCVRIKDGDELKAVFVSGIVIDLIKTNKITEGMNMKIEYLGKQKTQDGKREYNNYKVFFK